MKRMLMLLFLIAPAAEAQTYWRVSSAIAGVTVGAGAGLVIEEMRQIPCFLDFDGSSRCERHPEIPIGFAALYGIAGYLGGSAADERLARGESLTAWTRFRLRAHLVITPAVLVPVAVAKMDPGETRSELLWAAFGGGVVGGYLLQRGLAPALLPRTRVSIAPSRDGVTLTITSVR